MDQKDKRMIAELEKSIRPAKRPLSELPDRLRRLVQPSAADPEMLIAVLYHEGEDYFTSDPTDPKIKEIQKKADVELLEEYTDLVIVVDYVANWQPADEDQYIAMEE